MVKVLKARQLAAKAYTLSDVGLADGALAVLKHRPRRDRVALALAALVKGGGVSPFAFTYNGQPFTFAGVQFTYGAPV